MRGGAAGRHPTLLLLLLLPPWHLPLLLLLLLPPPWPWPTTCYCCCCCRPSEPAGADQAAAGTSGKGLLVVCVGRRG